MKRLIVVVVVVATGISWGNVDAGSTTLPAARPPAVQQALTALDKLAQYGYTVGTPKAADRAIRHWQKVNGLTVDGIVGPQTLASLGITTAATVTTPAPATRVSPPAATGHDGTVEDIIRDVWPDDLEARALAIAHRESRFVPAARNSCCWGLFQIHWQAHRSWMGLDGPEQLLDAHTNAEIAYALYQRAGGWGPWQL
jgi:hypothetical protein